MCKRLSLAQVSADPKKLERPMIRKRLFDEAEDEAMLRAWLRWHARHGFEHESFTTARNRLPQLDLQEVQVRACGQVDAVLHAGGFVRHQCVVLHKAYGACPSHKSLLKTLVKPLTGEARGPTDMPLRHGSFGLVMLGLQEVAALSVSYIAALSVLCYVAANMYSHP